MTLAPPRPIDPFARQHGGRYRDELVSVTRHCGPRAGRRPQMVRTHSFDLTSSGERLDLVHYLDDAQVDDDLAGVLNDELFEPGWARGSEIFERLFTGIVLTSADDPLDAWELFYRNTLRRLDGSRRELSGHGSIAEYAPVYRHAEQLLSPGRVLEVGCCFGFLSLRLAAAGREVWASDLSTGTVRVLRAIADRLDLPVQTLAADAAHHPLRDSSVDTVIALHLLEHLDPDHGARVLGEAIRLASRRVVVAVPFEPVPDPTFGHLRAFTLADLDRLGDDTGRPFDVHEHHGGWLVIDAA